MRFLPDTLYGRLSGLILILIVIVGILYVALVLQVTRTYVEEVDQTLNRDLAANMVMDGWLTYDRTSDNDAFDRAVQKIGEINRRIEIYVLDLHGNIVRYSTSKDTVKRQSVSLGPIAAFLGRSQEPPILGDDPRDIDQQKIFSVAPIHNGEVLAGYLYIVVGGKQYDSVISMLRSNYVLRLSLSALAGGLVVVLIVGLISFRLLTRRLRRLAAKMDSFRRSADQHATATAPTAAGRGIDEIDQIAETFADASRRIDRQMLQLKHADQSRRDFLAGVSHDLRTPLSAMQGYIETILIKADTLSARQRTKYLTLAFNNGRKLRRMVDDLFEFSTLDMGDRPLRSENFSLSDLVQDICQELELRARQAGIGLTANIDNGVSLVKGDVGLIQRLLINLIDNALKFTRPGGSVGIRLVPARSRLTVEIRDTGIGIDKAQLPRVFEPFYSVEPSTAETRDGAGLGLAIAARIAEMHDSRIQVESPPGGGTLFRFCLEMVPGNSSAITGL